MQSQWISDPHPVADRAHRRENLRTVIVLSLVILKTLRPLATLLSANSVRLPNQNSRELALGMAHSPKLSSPCWKQNKEFKGPRAEHRSIILNPSRRSLHGGRCFPRSADPVKATFLPQLSIPCSALKISSLRHAASRGSRQPKPALNRSVSSLLSSLGCL